jgi:hypothetical protein
MRLIDMPIQASQKDMEGSVYVGKGSLLENPYEREDRSVGEPKYIELLISKILRRDPATENAIRSLRGDSVLLCPGCLYTGEIIREIHSFLFSYPTYDQGLQEFYLKYGDRSTSYTHMDDGVTHINVYSKGKTALGRALSIGAYSPFNHPVYGRFDSIQGFWYWLALGQTNDRLRSFHSLSRPEDFKMSQTETNILREVRKLSLFEAEVKKAILCKIEQTPSLSDALKDSKLPLTHYTVWTDGDRVLATYPKDYDWVHEYIFMVREWLNGWAYKLLIAGSRSITHLDSLDLAMMLPEDARTHGVIEIVSGLAKGADTLAIEIANEMKLPVARFPADWDTHGKSAGYIRNKEMGLYADAALILWDGESKGAKHMQDEMKRLGKPCWTILPNRP